ncbi:hypothetical protein P170DRAFT_288723 [Aspergillus steynii IBT 23096]|uniref:Uncharacterized protein n=1 Tax=Aspergillus steynii IBT 23096 TaxID=1392250 RepID=A0A2I2FVC9_9EURO|nr:uncharacterized protein P170DRAFT_288723 [Aspergillus steynii IBT 23096]PLB44582.1 hypothetical protein P170DRAFT_288723 [Aspergillus steynii IBT 23096]
MVWTCTIPSSPLPCLTFSLPPISCTNPHWQQKTSSMMSGPKRPKKRRGSTAVIGSWRQSMDAWNGGKCSRRLSARADQGVLEWERRALCYGIGLDGPGREDSGE